MNGKRAMVTGIGGFVGPYLAQALADRGALVFGVDRPGHKSTTTGATERRGIDILDEDRLAEYFREAAPDYVFHLAAAANTKEAENAPEAAQRTNVAGTESVARAVRRIGRGCRLIFVSSGSVYAPTEADVIDEASPIGPVSVYGQTKLAAENALVRAADGGLDYVIVRPFNHTGVGQTADYVCSDFARQAAAVSLGLAPPILFTGNLEPVRDFSDVKDVVAAYVALAEKAPSRTIVNVASGNGRSIRSIVEHLANLSGRRPAIAESAVRRRAVDAPRMVGSTRKLDDLVGRRDPIDFEKTLTDLYGHWRSKLGDRRI